VKLFTIPFLFFCAINSSISEFRTDLIFQETDSLAYYASIANDPKTNTQHPKAFKFYSRLKQQNLKQGDTIKTVNNLRQIAIIQNNWGDYYASEASVAEALSLLENLKRTDSVIIKSKIGLYNTIGRINHALLKYESALSYFEKGLQMATSQVYINIIKNNMALVLRDQGNYDEAETVFLEVYDSRLKTKDTLRIARALNNLAKVRAKLNKPEAYNDLMDALNMRLRHNDVIGSYSSYKNLSIYYLDSANTTEALRYANEYKK
jgi:tetratricopeptide (TPR) repeat protein